MTTPVWLKPGLIGVGVGAVALAVLGFTVGGWMTTSKAENFAASPASMETVAALVPFCLAASKADVASMGIIDKLKVARRYERDDIVMEAGWATAPGAERASSKVATECAEQIIAAS
jgi:hypothetical protein